MKIIHSFWFHFLFWIVFTALFVVIEAGYKGEYYGALLTEVMNLPLRLVVVYLNYFYLLPSKLLEGKVYPYLAYTAASIIIFGFFQRLISYYILDYIYPDIPDFGLWLPYKFITASLVLAAPLFFLIGLWLMSYFSELRQKNEQLKSEKLQAELSFLKSQINPHFLFNTLNNLYGLALEQSKKVPDLILKLSEMLNYSLYEADTKAVLLSKEIEILENYIALESQRYEDRVDTEFTYPESLNAHNVPPLLLINLVENAFKHSVKEEAEVARIRISLEIDKNNLLFIVRNTIPQKNDKKLSEKKGIGLDHLRRRLIILYGNDFELNTGEAENEYISKLLIPLP